MVAKLSGLIIKRFTSLIARAGLIPFFRFPRSLRTSRLLSAAACAPWPIPSERISANRPSGNSQEEEIASVLFSAYSQQFYLFDFEKGELKILDCPMNNGEKIYSCFRSEDNICYETWDGDDIFRCYLTTMDDLMALETKSLDLSHSLLDLDNLEQ